MIMFKPAKTHFITGKCPPSLHLLSAEGGAHRGQTHCDQVAAGGNPVTDRPIKVIAGVEIFSATGEAIIRSPDSARLHHPHSINNTAGRERAIHFLIRVS